MFQGIGSPLHASPLSRRKSVSFIEMDRKDAFTNFCKLLEELLQAMKRYIGQQKKIHEKVNEVDINNDLHQRVVQNYYEEFKAQLQEKKNEALQKTKDRRISEHEFGLWIKQEKKKIENQSKFFTLAWTDQGKFIRKYDIQPPSVILPLTPQPEAPVTTSTENCERLRSQHTVTPFEMSFLNSSGRASVDASGLLGSEENIDDFLNRSGRKEPPQRYKLDSCLNDSVPVEEISSCKTSPKKEYVNEPYPNVAPLLPPELSQKSSAEPLDGPQCSNIDLNVSEEGLEEVKKPEPLLDFNISTAMAEYEKRMIDEKQEWHTLYESLESPAKGMDIIGECLEIVWKVRDTQVHILKSDHNNWKTFLEEYKAPNRFQDLTIQKMYDSEWMAVLVDVFEISGILYSIARKTKSIHNMLPTYCVVKDRFAAICREYLLKKRRKGRFVEQKTRQYNWDVDPSRRNAYELAMDLHNSDLPLEKFL